jgi:hypothetical protein
MGSDMMELFLDLAIVRTRQLFVHYYHMITREIQYMQTFIYMSTEFPLLHQMVGSTGTDNNFMSWETSFLQTCTL